MVLVLEKSFRLLEAFTLQRPEWGLGELSRYLQMPKSTVQHILATLVSLGYVDPDPITHRCRLGGGMLRLGQVAAANLDIRKAALPIMRWLRDTTGETVHLNVRQGWQRVLIERADSAMELRAVSEVGQPSPLHCGASAKVLLAVMPDAEIERYLASGSLEALTPQSPVDPETLWRQVREIRSAGYAFSVGERIVGVVSFSSPVYDRWGEVVAGISVTMPSVRFRPQDHQRLRDVLREAARRLSAALGASGEAATGTQHSEQGGGTRA